MIVILLSFLWGAGRGLLGADLRPHSSEVLAGTANSLFSDHYPILGPAYPRLPGHAASVSLKPSPTASVEDKGQGQSAASQPMHRRQWMERSLTLTLTQVAALIGSALWLALVGPPRVPPTYESSVCLYALLFGCLASCGLAAYVGWVILKTTSNRGPSYIDYLLAASFWTPLLGLFLAYLRPQSWHSFKETLSFSSEGDNNGSTIRNVVEDVSKALGLNQTIPTIYPPNCFNPQVIGTRPDNAVLVLPPTLATQTLNACKGDRILTQALLRVVVAHELSHVRNGDIRFLPLLLALRRYLPICFGIILAMVILAKLIAGDTLGLRMAIPSLRLFIFSAFLLGLLTKLALTQRERLADATAVLVVQEEDLRKILLKREGGYSPWERLLFSFRCSSSFADAVLGLRMAQPAGLWGTRWRSYFFRQKTSTSLEAIRRSDNTRLNELIDKMVSFPLDNRPSWASLIALSAIAGIILAGFSYFLLLDFMMFSQAYQVLPDVSLTSGFRQAHHDWLLVQKQNLWWVGSRQLLPVLLSCLLVGGALLPLRDLPHGFGFISSKHQFQAVIYILAALFFTALFYLFLAPSRLSEFPSFPALTVSPLQFLAWLLVVSGVFLATLFMRLGTPAGQIPWLLAETVFGLVFVGFGFLSCFAIYSDLALESRFICAFGLVALSTAMSQIRWFNHIAAQRNYSRESMRWIRVGGITRMFSNRTGGIFRFPGNYCFWFCAYSLVVYLLVPCSIALVSQSWLVGMDTLGPKFLKGATLFDRPILPTTWLGMALVFSVFIFSIFRASSESLGGRFVPDRLLEKAGPMATLLHRLELNDIRHPFSTAFLSAIKTARHRSHQYVCQIIDLPLLHRTCGVIHCAFRLDLPQKTIAPMIVWLKACGNPKGGFGPAPHTSASLPHTAVTLQTLHLLKRLPQRSLAVHKKWLEQELATLTKGAAKMVPSDWLEAMSLAVEGLQACGELFTFGPIVNSWMSHDVFQVWLATRRGAHDTLNLLRILECCGDASKREKEWLHNHWLTQAETRWVTLNPGTHLNELADGVEVLHRLAPETYLNRSSTVRITDNLIKAFSRGAFGQQVAQTPDCRRNDANPSSDSPSGFD
jgi:hypothetical protein